MSTNLGKEWPYLIMRFNLWFLLFIFLIPTGIVTLYGKLDSMESKDVLSLALVFAFILLVFAALEAWMAYLRHLESEAKRIDERQQRLEKEESDRREFIRQQSEKDKKIIKKIFNDLYDDKLKKMEESLAKQLDIGELLRLAKELKSTTEEHYDSERKVTKTTTHFVPDDVRNKILNHFPRLKVEGEEQNDEEHE